jgi:hypothetical protein
MVVASFVEEENTTTRVSVSPDMHGGPSNKENPSKVKLPPHHNLFVSRRRGVGWGGKG